MKGEIIDIAVYKLESPENIDHHRPALILY